jgi:hypothetical protein
MTNNVKRAAVALLIIASTIVIFWSLSQGHDAKFQCEDVRGGVLIADNGQGNCLVDGVVIFVGN